MIMEVVILNIRAGQGTAFEAGFRQASPIIAAMPGYISHEIKRCMETPDRYLLLVSWETLDAHMVGFRNSADYQEWRRLLHHFYEPMPTVEHYQSL